MVNDKWIIGIDLDGTLLRGREYGEAFKVSELTRKVLHELHRLGHIVCIDTGRNYFSSKDVYESIGLNVPIINHAGALIHNPMDDTFEDIKVPLDTKELSNLYNDPEYKDNVLGYFYSDDKGTFYIDGSMDELKKQIEEMGARNFHGREYDPTKDEVFTANIVYKNIDGYDLADKLDQKYKSKFNVVPWFTQLKNTLGYDGIEVNTSLMAKGKALLVLADKLGISRDNTMGIGDSDNDRELMTTPSIGVAVKNATDEIKELANEVTKFTNVEEGVAKYLIDKFNLNIEY